MVARLLKATVDCPAADVALIPEPRGAFSNLQPYTLPDVQLGPDQIRIQPLVGLSPGPTCLCRNWRDQLAG